MYFSHLFDLLFSGTKRNLMVSHMLFEKQNKLKAIKPIVWLFQIGATKYLVHLYI